MREAWVGSQNTFHTASMRAMGCAGTEPQPHHTVVATNGARLLDEVGLTGRNRDGFRTFPDGSNLTIQIAARAGGPVDIERHRRRHRVLELDQRRRRRRRLARRLQHDRQLRRVG